MQRVPGSPIRITLASTNRSPATGYSRDQQSRQNCTRTSAALSGRERGNAGTIEAPRSLRGFLTQQDLERPVVFTTDRDFAGKPGGSHAIVQLLRYCSTQPWEQTISDLSDCRVDGSLTELCRRGCTIASWRKPARWRGEGALGVCDHDGESVVFSICRITSIFGETSYGRDR